MDFNDFFMSYKLGDTVAFHYLDGRAVRLHVHMIGSATGSLYLFFYDEKNMYAPPVRATTSHIVEERMYYSKNILIEKEKENTIPDYGIRILSTEDALTLN